MSKDKKRLGWENKPADNPETGDTTVNVNVAADKPADTVVEKTVKKVVVEEDDKSDDTPTPSTESA